MLTQINERTYELRHERLDSFIEIWLSQPPNHETKWFWSWRVATGTGHFARGAARGSGETNVFVAIEKAMVELEKAARG